MILAPGTLIARYRLLEPLGRGGMGEVWLAEDTQLPRKVALKLLPASLAADPEAVERLLREAQAAASIDHPGVVTVYEAGLAEGRPFLAMQRVEGDTLEKRLAAGPLPIAETVAIAQAIADALAEVHALGIVHRDLKPANVVLTSRGPKILDFGVASVKGAARLTQSGAAIGTPQAMSPEQLRGLPTDNRADLWSLGVLMYECLAGRPPFGGESFEAIAYQVLNTSPTPLAQVRPEVGRDLEYMVMKLLRRDPAQRYSRAEDLLADFASCEWCAVDAPPASAEPQAPRLAVLPFELLSSVADDEYLAMGLVEDLIVDLTRVAGVRVASRAEVVGYAGRALPPRTLARELAADYLLQGSVRRAGERARISVQLVRGDGHVLWAERYDRVLADLFDVQAEVSRSIVAALQVTLAPEEREMLDRAPTNDAEAYTLYLRARALLDSGARDENHRAELLLRDALERDPRFALAMGALAECHAVRLFRWYENFEQNRDAARKYADAAEALDPGMLTPHIARTYIGLREGDAALMKRSAEAILRLDPDNAEALQWTGHVLLMLGEPEEGERVNRRLVERYPDNWRAPGNLLNALQMLGRLDEVPALQQMSIERTLAYLKRRPDDEHARSILGITLAQSGHVAEGLAEARRALARAPYDSRVLYNLACTLAAAGLKDEAIEKLAELTRGLPGSTITWPTHDPDLASLRDDPRFIALYADRWGAAPRS